MEPELNSHNKEEYPPMHTAEHILNQTMVRMFGCARSMNTHIEKKKSKCDYILENAPTDVEIIAIENKINEIIEQNLPVTVSFIKYNQASNYVDITKLPPDVSDTLRIVKVGDYDTCACIGNHVRNTAEIGNFHIISHDYSQGRWRVRFKVEGQQ